MKYLENKCFYGVVYFCSVDFVCGHEYLPKSVECILNEAEIWTQKVTSLYCLLQLSQADAASILTMNMNIGHCVSQHTSPGHCLAQKECGLCIHPHSHQYGDRFSVRTDMHPKYIPIHALDNGDMPEIQSREKTGFKKASKRRCLSSKGSTASPPPRPWQFLGPGGPTSPRSHAKRRGPWLPP